MHVEVETGQRHPVFRAFSFRYSGVYSSQGENEFSPEIRLGLGKFGDHFADSVSYDLPDPGVHGFTPFLTESILEKSLSLIPKKEYVRDMRCLIPLAVFQRNLEHPPQQVRSFDCHPTDENGIED